MLAKVAMPLVLAASTLATQTTIRASVGPNGVEANAPSQWASISANGRFVAFETYASNLVAGDTNASPDVFLHNMQTGETERVSVSGGGAQANASSARARVSADGRFVAFESYATNLVAVDTNNESDVFIRDRLAGTTALISVSTAGTQANSHSNLGSISADGRFVAFSSNANNLVAGDTNSQDVFVRDMQSAQTFRVSVSSSGAEANHDSLFGAISADGRYVAFHSTASNLVAGDGNASDDVFVRDLQTSQTTRVSVSSAGGESMGESREPAISADGRYVAFASYAPGLVVGDTNGFTDVFVHDRATATTVRISVDSNGGQADSNSSRAVISADGRFVGFQSFASNLVSGDSNGTHDIFVHDRQTVRTHRVSVGTFYFEGPYPSIGPSISATGRFVAFNTMSEFVAQDSNGHEDVYFRDWWNECFVDNDLDGFGTGPAIPSPDACGAGFAAVDGDCDDLDPARNPGEPELCNGVDEDCDGLIDDGFMDSYCTAGTTVHGCVPTIAGIGTPSSTSSAGFEVVVSNTEGQRYGTIFYGFYPISIPWALGSTSLKCVANPVQRTGVIDTGGTAGLCDGRLSLDMNTWLQSHPNALGSPFVAGQVFYAQGWFRDPGAPKGTNLSDGLRLTLCN